MLAYEGCQQYDSFDLYIKRVFKIISDHRDIWDKGLVFGYMSHKDAKCCVVPERIGTFILYFNRSSWISSLFMRVVIAPGTVVTYMATFIKTETETREYYQKGDFLKITRYANRLNDMFTDIDGISLTRLIESSDELFRLRIDNGKVTTFILLRMHEDTHFK